MEGNRILDASGTVFLIRGTQLPEFPLPASSPGGSPPPRFGPYSATTLSTIRLRWNMNTVRLPVNVSECNASPSCFPDLVRVVSRANALELAVILSAGETGAAAPSPEVAQFWRRCAATFTTASNVIFELFSGTEPSGPAIPQLIRVIRSAGVAQPVIVPGGSVGFPKAVIDQPNLIYDFNLPLPPAQSGAPLEAILGSRVPLLANLPDLPLAPGLPGCRDVPNEPSVVEQHFEASLRYFDLHGVSWIASEYVPGKLITDYTHQDATTLENGWTCGAPDSPQAGIGQIVQFHLWNGRIRGLFATNQAGGFLLARGAVTTLYGAILAERDSRASGPRLPAQLGGISVQVTDRSGSAHLAGLRWASAGWGQVDFVVPQESMAGPAQITILRADGTSASINATVVNVAPALVTESQNSHGFAAGRFVQTLPGGRRRSTPTFRCDPTGCRGVPIPISEHASTLLQLSGSGFRNARSISDITVKVAGVSVPLVSFGPARDPGADFLTVRLPPALRGRGETPVVASVLGRLSNVALLQLGSRVQKLAASPYQWELPEGFPVPRVPPDNPMSPVKVRVGRYLFYDKRLSRNGAESCATCHRQELAFTDGRAAPLGATGQPHPRSAMSLVNVAYSAALTWSNPDLRSLEQQALLPMFSETPVELGLHRSGEFLNLLRADARYRELFSQAFPASPDPFTIANVAKAIAAFERTIISARSPYDRYRYSGDTEAITDSAKRGEVLFFNDASGACFRCHGGFNFSDAVDYQGREPRPVPFHNTGLYNLPGPFSYPPPNLGIYSHTEQAADIGKFKAPSLRNIALTAPYMHDGSIPTLEAVLDHYVAGGRAPNPNKDKLLKRLYLSTQNREDLLAFLRSLTDEQLIHDPRFSDPW